MEGDTMSAPAESKQESQAEQPQELVKLTTRAAEKVKSIRVEEKIEDGYGLRLKVMGGGCSGFAYDLFFDQAQDVDQSFESQGVKMLCDQMSLMYLVGTEIDYVEDVQGSGFKFNNPNVKSTCGCGSSFSV
jgi:iron-sulfur cluster assembly accessory protein